MAGEEKLEQNQREEPMSLMTRVVITGLVGGLLWSALGYLAYVFNFIEISPNVVLQPWAVGEWKNGVFGNFVSIFILGVIGIGAAIGYFAFLKKFQQFWMGLIYGAVLWGLVFFILNPMFPGIKTVPNLTLDTIVTSFCLFILFGLFVGYTVSYEYNELQPKHDQNHGQQTSNE
ncbi:YqhR family membrane protein [Sutcliffiella cohnii]|uniref:Membrane protein YqhR n=1 Tax=Sutcliffiella cohnii TaxID=33932 RepID=A0A223KSP5_9BACI|nr:MULTISPECIES: YqhR family membrane protein [Sutcliffiella]AST92466.1 hypothetical protein BC6307_14770 [Sutcliffiella cohnii]MED4017060.1 YqhR family membrane protein [Sutcliffiella cohnii]WBL13702.1 YqhR family membrane protein [Sutcliffiella sp. NC1]